MKPRTKIALASAIAVAAIAVAPISVVADQTTRPLAERIDAATHPRSPACVCTSCLYSKWDKPELNCWQLTVTLVSGDRRIWGYFESKTKCEEFVPQIEAELHATRWWDPCQNMAKVTHPSKLTGQTLCSSYDPYDPQNPDKNFPNNCGRG